MTTAVIVAAGSSRRMGFDKLFAELHGRPVLAWAIAAFEQCAEVSAIIVVASPARMSLVETTARQAAPQKFSAVVAGGAERHLSVAAGLDAVPDSAELIAVHDGARPLVGVGDISSVVARARESGAAALAHPVVETLQRADGEQRVCKSIAREGIWAMETPQIFRRDLLVRAYRKVRAEGSSPTDEVSAVLGINHPVFLVASTHFNLKITRPNDLELAKRLAPGALSQARVVL
ncbi:MAG: 2-C-methyl-D-erythritol 4-phosphate cytidylyltransferase [Verrucomicrobiales bacterium]